jgi:Domain of unknown function (DUF4209)
MISYSAFVPDDRFEIFHKGLLSGFNENFVVALHLLVPQLENSIRHLMHLHGMSTTSIDSMGLQREIDLNSVLEDDRVTQCLPEGMVVELRCLMTDGRGPNLRNRLAHGLMSDASFDAVEAFYAWWFILRLCLRVRTTQAPAASKPEDSGGPQASP